MGIGPGSYPLGLGPWMLLGFIPLFFGLGLILVYVLTREEKKPEPPLVEDDLQSGKWPDQRAMDQR
jgi:hypothetical protein